MSHQQAAEQAVLSQHFWKVRPVDSARAASDAPEPAVLVGRVHSFDELVDQAPPVRSELLTQVIQPSQCRRMNGNGGPKPPSVRLQFSPHQLTFSYPIIAATPRLSNVGYRVHFCAHGSPPIMVIM